MAEEKNIQIRDIGKCHINIDRFNIMVNNLNDNGTALVHNLVDHFLNIERIIKAIDIDHPGNSAIMLAHYQMIFNTLVSKGIIEIHDENSEPSTNYEDLFGPHNEDDYLVVEEDEGGYDDF
jgi:hypothetical protein